MTKQPSSLFAKAIRDFEASRFTAAERTVRQLRLENPNHPDITYLAGVIASRLGKYEEAALLLEKAAIARPHVAALHGELGSVLLVLGMHADAAAAFRRALAANPRLPEAHSNLARAQYELGQISEAIESYKTSLTLNPSNADVLNDLGNILQLQKALPEAIEIFARALAINPRHWQALEGLIFTRMRTCDWQDFDQQTSHLLNAVRAGEFALDPFRSLMLSTEPEVHFSAAKSISMRFVQTKARFVHSRDSAPRKLRIGYLSGNFAEHPLAYSAVEVIERHDRCAHEIFGYSTAPSDDSGIRRRIEGAFDTFIDARHLSDPEIADKIYRDQIDVLVDLQGHTEGLRLKVLAYRPAPIQVSWLGFPGTTGASFIDYVLADSVVTPDTAQRVYSEKIIRLPNCYFPTDGKRLVDAGTPSRDSVGLPQDGFVFCSFNNAFKITPGVFATWMRILKAVPASVLWLLVDDATLHNLGTEAVTRGVDRARLVQAKRLPSPNHLARHRLADLMLDTLPCNAHTTAADALWMGLPVLTLLGEAFSGRVAASMLKAVDLSALIVNSVEDYETTAVRLATRPGVLATYREQLLSRQGVLPLFDTAGLTKSIEAAFNDMAHIRWRDRPISNTHR